jgi:hypothetical protein
VVDQTAAYPRTVWGWVVEHDGEIRMLLTPDSMRRAAEKGLPVTTLFTVEPDDTRVTLPRVLSADARNKAMQAFQDGRMSMQSAFDALVKHYREGGK